MGNNMCMSLDPTHNLEDLPPHNLLQPHCQCCSSDITGNCEKKLCPGGCEIVGNLLTKGISWNVENERWCVRGLNDTFMYSDDAIMAADNVSRSIRFRGAAHYSYNAFCHVECCTDELRLGGRNSSKVQVCDVCAAWYNYLGGRSAGSNVRSRQHCMMRQRLEDELNPPTVNPIFADQQSVHETKESAPSLMLPLPVHVSIPLSRNERVAPSEQQMLLHRNKQLQEEMLQLQDACKSALALERNTESYSVGHRARETAYRVAAGAYDIILLQIDDIRSSTKKLILDSKEDDDASDDFSSDRSDDDDDDAFIAENKARVVYLCSVSSAYRQHAAVFQEKMRRMKEEERMNQQTSM